MSKMAVENMAKYINDHLPKCPGTKKAKIKISK